MLKPLGSFSLAFGSLSSAVAIGSAGTGASFTAASFSGRPSCHEGGGVGACAAGPPGACEPGPAPGCAACGTGGWLGGDGFTAGCCAASGPAMATRPVASAASNTVREHDSIVFIAHSSPGGVIGDALRRFVRA